MNFFVTFLSPIFLAAANPLCIMFLIVVTFGTVHRAAFLRALFLSLVGLLINENLKLYFQVPYVLPEYQGYAFPSGHTMAVATFWGWLMYEYPQWKFLSVASSLIAGVIFYLLYSGRHQQNEVVVSCVLALLLIIIFMILLKRGGYSDGQIALTVLLMSIPLAIALGPTVYYKNILASQGLLLGYWLGSGLFNEPLPIRKLFSQENIFFVGLVFFSIFSLFLIFQLLAVFGVKQLSLHQTMFFYSFIAMFLLTIPALHRFADQINYFFSQNNYK